MFDGQSGSEETEDGDGRLPGMPAPLELRLKAVGDSVVVSHGGRALAIYERGDRAMRNLAIVSLTRAGVPGVEVAALFGIRPEHVSRLRRQAAENGSRGLLPPTGRPPKLDARARARAFAMSEQGVPGSKIARTLRVSEATISRLLAGRRPASEQPRLPGSDLGPAGSGEAAIVPGAAATDTGAATAPGAAPTGIDAGAQARAGEPVGIGESGTRVKESSGRSVYAGAMLLHPFLETVGAGRVFGALDSGPGRRYDSTAVALQSVFCFALGCSSIEGAKHLQRADAGMLVGVESFPHLRTLRPRLAALADAADPLRVQAALAKAMLAADDVPPSVFFVDGHFVAYAGSRPVAKGWNTRRRHAEPGREDTVIVDDQWRAICFQTGPPGGLATGMLHPVEQLLEICGPRPLMIGFDRGGSYPKAFTALRDRGVGWVTYRRAPLTTPTAKARRSWVSIDTHRRYIHVADEQVNLDGYGTCRQLTVYEHDRIALQILTSDTTCSAASLAWTLRCRWRIENTFKYLEDHHGLHWLCDYRMDHAPDTTMIRNPARTTALATLRAHEQTIRDLEAQIGRHTTTTTAADSNPAETLCMLKADLYTARADVRTAKAALKQIPAKLPANTINPDATRATPRINRRAIQTVLRLLAYNAELDLARALNTYLKDPDEYRAITRHLLHQPGHIHYTPTTITVTLDPPHAPRIHRALNLLIDQINHQPPKLAGDHRPITYQIAAGGA